MAKVAKTSRRNKLQGNFSSLYYPNDSKGLCTKLTVFDSFEMCSEM